MLCVSPHRGCEQSAKGRGSQGGRREAVQGWRPLSSHGEGVPFGELPAATRGGVTRAAEESAARRRTRSRPREVSTSPADAQGGSPAVGRDQVLPGREADAGSRTRGAGGEGFRGAKLQERIGRGGRATERRANGLAGGSKLRSAAKRIETRPERRARSLIQSSTSRGWREAEAETREGRGRSGKPNHSRRGTAAATGTSSLGSEGPLETDGDKARAERPRGDPGSEAQGSKRPREGWRDSCEGKPLKERKAWTRLRHETRPRTSGLRKPLRG